MISFDERMEALRTALILSSGSAGQAELLNGVVSGLFGHDDVQTMRITDQSEAEWGVFAWIEAGQQIFSQKVVAYRNIEYAETTITVYPIRESPQPPVSFEIRGCRS